MTSKELLKRIDEKDYLTEREHREFLKVLEKDLEILEIFKELFKYKGNCEWLFHYLENENQKQLIKEWLDNDK